MTVNTRAAPAVTNLDVGSDPGADATYGAGDVIRVNVHFDGPLAVDTTRGTPSLRLRIGTITVHATYDAHDSRPTGFNPNGDGILAFKYTVRAGDFDADGITLSNSGFSGVYNIELNGGAIRTSDGTIDAGQRIGSDLAFTNNADHKVDTGGDVRSVAITSRPRDGAAYRAGETVEVRVRVNSLTVRGARGAPRIALTVGTATRHAAFVRADSPRGQHKRRQRPHLPLHGGAERPRR